MVRGSIRKRFLNAMAMDLQVDLTKKMRKVNCPVCLSAIILEAVTNEGDVILCPYCDAMLVVSGFNRRPTAQSINLY